MSDASVLVRLEDTDLALADPADDVRGKGVVDADGEEVGDVDNLIIDQEERRVRFLRISGGGVLGMGKRKLLVPVDAVTAVDDVVHVNTKQEQVVGSPEYDPDLVLDRTTVAGLYDYYGYPPYWSASYVPPRFPYGPL